MGAIAIVGLLLAGAAVGATSIGGVLVVPVLTAWAGTGLGGAIAASSFAFAFTGAAAFAWPARRGLRGTTGPVTATVGGAVDPPAAAAAAGGAVDPPAAAVAAAGGGLGGWPLHGCALLGAAIGAATLGWLPSGGIRTGLGLLAVATGIHGLWRLRAGVRATGGPSVAAPGSARYGQAEAGPVRLAAIGLGVGCASAWSGTGGPVVLLPLLALLGWPTDRAVAAAQRIQLPVALAAAAVHLAAGRLDLRLGLVVGALVLAGWTAGRWLAGRLSTRRLAQAVALAMIGVGLWYLRST